MGPNETSKLLHSKGNYKPEEKTTLRMGGNICKWSNWLRINLQTYKQLMQLNIKTTNNHKKEWNWVICSEVDGPRVCHTEWSKSERGKQISHINAYMWNLEKWYRWTGLQGRNRDTDVENKRMDTKGGKHPGCGGGVLNWKIGMDMYTLICMKWMTSKNLL